MNVSERSPGLGTSRRLLNHALQLNQRRVEVSGGRPLPGLLDPLPQRGVQRLRAPHPPHAYR